MVINLNIFEKVFHPKFEVWLGLDFRLGPGGGDKPSFDGGNMVSEDRDDKVVTWVESCIFLV